jgi:hypothetical protein
MFPVRIVQENNAEIGNFSLFSGLFGEFYLLGSQINDDVIQKDRIYLKFRAISFVLDN